MSTQHFLGAAKYTRVSDTQITVRYQVRAAHVRWKDASKKEEIAKGHGHGEMVQHASKTDGVWKLTGWCPHVFWNEHDFDEVVRIGLALP